MTRREPVGDTQSIAHPEVVALLQKRCDDVRRGFRQNVALVGPPGVGKSSAILAALTQTDPALLITYCAVPCDPREVMDQWIQRWARAVLQGICGFRPEAGFPPVALPVLLSKASSQAPQTALRCSQLLTPTPSTAPQERLRNALVLPHAACQETGRCGVVVIDEFQRLDERTTSRTFHELGKVMMLAPSQLFVLSSSQPAMAQRILRERLDLLFGGFEVIHLQGMEASAVTTFLRAQPSCATAPDGMLTYLAWLTDGHPWLLDTIAGLLPITDSSQHLHDVLATQLGDSRQPIAHWCASRLRAIQQTRVSRACMHLLTVLAGQRSTLRPLARALGHTLTETSRHLARLLEWGLVDRQGEVYWIANPLWNLWFRHLHLPQQQATHVTRRMVVQAAATQLQHAYAAFTAAHQHTPVDRFMQLLGQFRDEQIIVDSRRTRLPEFDTIACQPTGPDTYHVTAQPRARAGTPWLYCIKASTVSEHDVATFASHAQQRPMRSGRRVVVGLGACEPAAVLLAKASRLWLWHQPTLHELYRLYQFPTLTAAETVM